MGQHVRAEGLEGEFVVVRVDKAHRTADLMHSSGTHRIERSVPFATIRMSQ